MSTTCVFGFKKWNFLLVYASELTADYFQRSNLLSAAQVYVCSWSTGKCLSSHSGYLPTVFALTNTRRSTVPPTCNAVTGRRRAFWFLVSISRQYRPSVRRRKWFVGSRVVQLMRRETALRRKAAAAAAVVTYLSHDTLQTPVTSSPLRLIAVDEWRHRKNLQWILYAPADRLCRWHEYFIFIFR